MWVCVFMLSYGWKIGLLFVECVKVLIFFFFWVLQVGSFEFRCVLDLWLDGYFRKLMLFWFAGFSFFDVSILCLIPFAWLFSVVGRWEFSWARDPPVLWQRLCLRMRVLVPFTRFVWILVWFCQLLWYEWDRLRNC